MHIWLKIVFFPKHHHETTIIDLCAVIVLVGEGRGQAGSWARHFTVIFSFVMHIYYLSLKLNAQQAVNSTKDHAHMERHRLNKG